jgi:O-succinylbenzoate synthase
VSVALNQVLATAKVVSLPLRTKFRGVALREALLFEGPEGWGEWSPFLEYADEEAAIWLEAAVDWAFMPQPKPLRDFIDVNATLPAVTPDEVAETLAPFGNFGTVKIKVAEAGEDLNNDLRRIFMTRKLFPQAKIRLDANGGYTPEQALMIAATMIENGVPLEYLEQPCKSVAELVQLRKTFAQLRLSVLVAADESVRKASDPIAVANAGGADLLVLKVAPLGGVAAALEIAQQAGLPVVVSSALETSIGLAMGLHLAACLRELPYASGLGTAALLDADVVSEPLIPIDGKLPVTRPQANAELLETHAASPERTQWWLERLERCWALL